MRPISVAMTTGMVIIWVLALMGLYHIASRHMAAPKDNPIALVAYSAALVALAGWMFQAWLSVRNSRKQHTMSVLLQTRLNPEFRTHAKRIDKAFPNGATITFAEITQKKNAKAFESVRWILNYYEFIAAGIEHGDLDERLMMDCMCTQLRTFCARTEDVIAHVREEDAGGKPSDAKRRVLKSLRKLQPRWLEKAEPTPWLVTVSRAS